MIFKGLSLKQIKQFFLEGESPLSVNDTAEKKCLLLNSVVEFIEIETRLFQTFFICLRNQLSYIDSIATY